MHPAREPEPAAAHVAEGWGGGLGRGCHPPANLWGRVIRIRLALTELGSFTKPFKKRQREKKVSQS